MRTSPNLRPDPAPVPAWTGLQLVLCAIAGALIGVLLFFGSDAPEEATAGVPFLEQALGAADAGAPLVRTLDGGATVELHPGGYRVEAPAVDVTLRSVGGGGELERFANGATRRTPFGWETVTVGRARTELHVTVAERQGRRTWRWELATLDLRPRVSRDGRVTFVGAGGLVAGTTHIAPVRILGADGDDVTPAGLRWSVARSGDRWWLELDLDDADLPLPYVIDPAVVTNGSATAFGDGGATPALPGAAGDLLIAHVAVRGNSTITAPGGWTLIETQLNGTSLRQSTYSAVSTGSNSTAFTWTAGARGGVGVVAFSSPHPTAPVQASSTNSGTAATATATGVTTTHPDELVVAFYGHATNTDLTQTAGEGLTSVYAANSGGGNPAGRTALAAAAGTQAAAGATGSKTAGAGANWVAQLVALRQAPDDGSGTATTGTSAVSAGSTGNTITFTYTAGPHGLAGGAVALDVPAGWSPPSTTGTAAGYTTASTGSVGVAGQRLTVTGVTLGAGATMTITYGSKAAGGAGATASAATGSVAWGALSSGTAAGTLAALGASPAITQHAADGSGTLAVSPTELVAGTPATITLTYTAAAGGTANGAVAVAIPAGWTAPTTTPGTTGYTTASTGTIGWNGGTRLLTVSGVTLAGGATLTVAYGTGGGGAVTVPAGSGSVTWQAQQRSTAGGALTALAASPASTYNEAPTATVSLAPASPTTGQTLTATATTGDAEGDPVTLTYVWKVDGVTVRTTSGTSSLTDTLDLAGAGNGDRGQTVSVEVTPNDGNADGATVSDAEVVANSAPTISAVSIDQASPRTNDTLTVTVTSADADGDARTYAYQWRRDGVDLAGETGATLDLSAAGTGDKGDAITVAVTANDGTASSAPSASAAVTVQNTAPVVDSVAVDQAAPGTDETLTLTVGGHDDDGDPLTYAYQWRKGGVDLGGQTGATLDLAAAGNGDKGDVLAARVTANDGSADSAPLTSAAVTVANSAPTISAVAIDQASPRTNDTLTVTVTSADADGDARTYAYQWRRGGVDLAGATGATLDLSQAGHGQKGDDISVEVTANDGSADSAPLASAEVTVQNSAPTVTSVAIDQAVPRTNDTLTVTVAAADADGDPVTVAHQWRRNGVDRFGETASTYDLAQIGNGDRGDAISVDVTADDGTASSAPSLSAAVTVANSAPVLSAVSIDQAAPATEDTVTATITASDPDGDTVTPARQWRRNGIDVAGETGATLDLSVAGNGDKGDAIALRVSVSDGTDSDGPLTSAAVTVANSAPAITGVSIVELAPGTDDTLTVAVTSDDLDGDGVAYAYQWRRDGVDIAGETGATLDLSVAGNGDEGDQITVRVTGDDGSAGSAPSTSAPRTVANTAPSAAVALSPASPTTAQTVTATATSADADGDTVTLTYVWKVDGVTVRTTAGSASLTDTLDLAVGGNGDEGETVSVEVTPNDGDDDGVAATDAALVGNAAPAATVTLAPAAPTTGQTVTATATTADPDAGDTVALTYVWKVDGVTVKTTPGSASLTDTLDLSVGGNGDEGETVSVEVTPNDGDADGGSAVDSVAVANSAPAMTSATIDQAAPTTNATLTVSVASSDADGDARTYAYQWQLDGSPIAGATGATLDLSQPGRGDKGDAITVVVTANDGDDDSAPLESAGVTVANSAPSATVALAPDPAGSNDVLTATAAPADADGDAVTLTYVWKVNGATVKTTAGSSSPTDTLDLSQPGNGNPGDTIGVEVTPTDGDDDGGVATDSVGIGNALPTATVALAPAAPTTGQTLTATATKGDTDGDPVTLTYVWKVDGVTVKTTAATAALTDTLDLSLAGNGDAGETVSVEVTPNDGLADGVTVSDSALVANTAPTATVALSPAAPKTDDLVTATAAAADADGDAVALTYVWKVDGVTVKTTAATAALTDTLDLGLAGNGDRGETVSVEVTPNDGAADGAASSDAAVVANSAPVLAAVAIDQAAPRTDDTLTLTVTASDADGDVLIPTRQWRRNGGALAGETGATLDLSLAGNGGRGDELDVQVAVSDGSASSATLTASGVTVANSEPTVVSATIDQAAPTTNEALSVTVVADDADGDATTATYQWARNGVDRFGETAAGYDLAVFENGQKGDAITVRVVVSDGDAPSAPVTSAAITVANSAPVVDTVAIDQPAPATGDALTVTVTSHDDDGDAVTNAYQWRNGGVDLAGETAATLDLTQPGNGDEGDAVDVRVVASDGEDDSAALTSAAVVVANTAPGATVVLSPAAPSTDAVVTATATAADADGEAVTLTYVWKVDGVAVKTTAATAALTDTLDLGLAGNGDKGESVSVEVTPNDGAADGTAAADAVTVANSAPTIASVSIDQPAPATGAVLTVSLSSADADGDGRAPSYQWLRNGVDLAGETGATLDLSQPGNGDAGDAVSVRVTVSDGAASSAPATSGAVTVRNSAPTVTSVTIDQASPRTNDTLTVSVASADDDGDAPTYAYQWLLDGADIAGATGATLDLSQAGHGDKGDALAVRVTASDGTDVSAPSTSAAVTVQNTAPVIDSLAIDQAAPRTLDTLTFTLAASDADGDPLTATRQWLLDGSDLAGETGAALDLAQAGNGDRGDTLAVRVSVSDGGASSAPSTSATVAVLNSAPVVDTVAIDQPAPATDDTLTLAVTSHDDDGDAVTHAYQWRNGGADLAGETGSTLDLSQPGNGARGDAVDVRVTADDGSAASVPLTSAAVTVANTAPGATVALAPASPRTDQTLTATATTADADGDPVTLTYVWKVDGATVQTTPAAAALTDTLDLATFADEGETVSVEVTPDDGDASGVPASDDATVANSAPTATVSLAPASPTTAQTVTATAAAADADGDAVTLTYVWKVDGAVVRTTAGSASPTDSLDLGAGGNGDRGQTVEVEVTPNDGDEDGTTASGSATVANSAPTATVALAPAAPATDDVLTATAAKADADGDAVTLTYVWKVDGSTVKTTPASASLTDTLDLGTAGNGDAGQTVSVEVTPHDGTAAGTAAADAVVVDLVPHHLAVTSSTADLASGAQRTLAVEVRDADGALVAGDDSTQVTVARSAGSGSVAGLGTAAAVDGVAELVVTGVLAGPVTLTATAAGLTGDDTSFTVVHGAAAAIDLAVSGTSASGGTTTLTATLEDAAGNTVTGDGSTVVAFARTGGAGTVAGLGTATAAAGVATLDVTNALAGPVDLEAEAPGLAPGTASFTVTPGAAATATTTVEASPATIVADGASTSTITVRLRDAAGNELGASGGVVALSLAGGGTLAAVTDVGDGTYAATLTSPALAGSGTVTATLDGDAVADDATVVYEHGPAVAVELAAAGPVVAGGTRTLTATIVDANGNTVLAEDAAVVTFATTGGPGTLGGLGSATASDGVATTTVTNLLAGAVDVEASAAGLGAGATSWTIAVGPVSDAGSTVTSDRASAVNNGVDAATITVALRDAGGNPVAGQTVTLDDGAASSTIAGGGATDAAGEVAFTVTSTTVETATYTATDTTAGLTLTDTATVSFVFDDATPPTNAISLTGGGTAHLSGSTVFYNGAGGGSFTLSSAVADGGAGPASAAYPAVARPGWTHGAETVTAPAGGPYASSVFTWAPGSTGTFTYDVTVADAWTPANTSVTTLTLVDDSAAPTTTAACDGGACDGAPSASAPVSVALAAGDGPGAGVAQIRYTLDGSDPTAVTGFPYLGPLSIAAEGTTTVKARAFDRVGNTEAVQAFAVEIDTVAPETTIDSAPAAATQETTPTFAFDADEPATFETRLDGGAWAPATSPLALGPLAEGTYTLEVRAADAAGNVDATPASHIWTIDTTAADTTIATAPAAATNDTSATFTFTASDAGPSFETRLDGGAWAPATSPLAVGPLAEGAHTLDVRAVDAAGNRDATPASHAWTIDTTAPETAIAVAPADPSSDATPTFSFSSDAGASFACSLDGGAFSACASPHVVAPALGDGPHTLDVRATDAAGNVDATPAQHAWAVDATAPSGALTAPAHGAAVSEDVVVASDSADGGSGVMHALFEVRLAATSDPWTAIGAADTTAPYAVTWDTTLVPDEDYELRVTTRDEAGNSTVSASREVTVDNTAPTLAVTAPTTVNLASADPYALAATAADGGTGVTSVLFEQCSETSAACDSDTWSPIGVLDTVAPYGADWAIPSDGTRLLRVTATDGAGRTGVEQVLVTVDRTRPTGAVTAPADGTDLRGSVALAASASDAAPGDVDTVAFQVSPAGAGAWDDVDTDGTAPYGATLDTTTLADGLYDLRVFTTDAAGNAETSPATVSVRVDNTAPATTDDAPAAWQDGDVAVTLSADDAGGSGVALTQYALDGGAPQSAAGPVTVSDEGEHTLEYRSRDAAGNWEAWRSTTVRIDLTAPVTGDDAPAAWQPGAVTVALSPADAGGSGLATTTWELDGGATETGTTVAVPATHGVHTITYRSTDAAGNVEADRTATVRVDRQAPTTTDDAPAGLTNLPVTVTLDATDPGAGVATTTYEVNGGPTQAGTSVAIPATTGTFTITYRSTDAVGNVEATRTATVQVDATAPTTTPTIAPRNPHNGPITVSLSAGDAGGAGVDVTRYAIDGGPESDGTAAVVAGADGPHTVAFYSVDALGNVEATQTVTVTIDTAGPTGTPGNPGSYLRGTAAELTWTPDVPADVSAVTFEFSTAGAGAWAPLPAGTVATPMLAEYTYAWNTTTVADGAYDLRVRVEDDLGNETLVLLPGLPKTVDNGDPAATVSTPAAGSSVSGAVALGGSAADALSGVTAATLQVKPAGAAGFTTVATSASGLVAASWDSTTVADGPVELKVVATDGAGNQGESAVVTFTVDNDAPSVSLGDPGAAVSGDAALTATAAPDAVSVAFEWSPAGAGTWTAIATDADPGDGFAATWPTGPLPDGLYDLRARATDGGGNVGTSPVRTTRVDNEQPTASLTAPVTSATVGGTAVALAAAATDAGSGVASVAFEVKHFGSGSFVGVATDTAAPWEATWDATTAPDGATELRAVVTDAAGNARTTAVVPVTVDSTGPSVTLAAPAAGAVVSGTVALTTTTGGGATAVRFDVSPAGAASWSELATDATAPFAHALDTTALADGLYDLRAVGYDALGNPSPPSVSAGVRFDNTAPALLSATPADGSVSPAAAQIVLTASEPVTAVAAELDGAPAPAPAIAGNELTFATGALADGLHVLSGRLEDASGTQVPFRIAVTIEGAPGADRPPVEKSVARTGTTTVVAAGGLATVSLPAAAAPAPPTPEDFLVLRVDPAPAGAVAVAPGTQLVEVTARWALAGTPVTQLAAPVDVLLPDPAGATAIPATSDDAAGWRLLDRLAGAALPAGAADGYHVDGAGVHVVTRHLTWFALMLDAQPPTAPRHIAGVVADDGLTIRWIPGTDASGRLGNVTLFVNGEPYREFGPTEYEAKLGPIEPGDTRSFHLVQRDAAGNSSGPSAVLRTVPSAAGSSLEAATAALAERGFAVGVVREQVDPSVAPGTVLAPAGISLAAAGAAIDLVVARGAAAPRTQLVLRVASARRVRLAKRTTVAARVQVTRPSRLTATLYSPARKRLFTWRRDVAAGATVVRLRLPAQVRRPGTYRLVWVARSDGESIRRTVAFRLLAQPLPQLRSPRVPVEVVLAGERPLDARLGRGARVVADAADPDAAFDLAASLERDVRVVVVDVDAYGLRLVRDLHLVFPELKLIALARDARVRARSLRAGAVLALPRSTPPTRLARAIARVGRP